MPLKVELRPHTAGSELLELRLLNEAREALANVIFAHITTAAGAASSRSATRTRPPSSERSV